MSKAMIHTVCFVLSMTLVLALAALPFPARAATQSEIDALEAERDEIRARQADIREQIDMLHAEKASLAGRKAALDEQTALNVQNIALIDRQIAIYDQMIADKAAEVEQAIESQELQFERYKTRVRAMEETNAATYISILLKATSLTDFLSRLSDVEDIVRSDKNVKAEYETARAHTEQALAEYEQIQAGQREKREELLVEKTRLEEQVGQAAALILQLEDDVEAYEAAYEKKEDEEAEVQARIDKLIAELQRQKEAEEAARRAYEAAQRQQQQPSSAGGSAAAGGSGTWVWPSGITYLTSRFGPRIHPIFGSLKPHSGVDVAASYGSAISAAAGGTVQISDYSASYGNYCLIYHSNGVSTLYAHMNALPSVSVGETVSAGQTVGYVGSTGWATAPHLHFEVRVNGSCVDPLDYYPDTSFTFSPDCAAPP